MTNIGVAAHIRAAAPGGPRYDSDTDSEQRSNITNGIWLCQTHAKLIDDDELTYSVSVLEEWKQTAEQMAALEAKGFTVRRASPFASLEQKFPKLLGEMRADLEREPFVREFILLSRKWSYNPGDTAFFSYFFEDHDEYLKSAMTILGHHGAIYDVAYNDVARFNFREEFVEYLIGHS